MAPPSPQVASRTASTSCWSSLRASCCMYGRYWNSSLGLHYQLADNQDHSRLVNQVANEKQAAKLCHSHTGITTLHFILWHAERSYAHELTGWKTCGRSSSAKHTTEIPTCLPRNTALQRWQNGLVTYNCKDSIQACCHSNLPLIAAAAACYLKAHIIPYYVSGNMTVCDGFDSAHQNLDSMCAHCLG